MKEKLITAAYNAMAGPNGKEIGFVIPPGENVAELRSFSIQGKQTDIKRQGPAELENGSYGLFKPFRTGNYERICSPQTSVGLQQAGKTEDVIAVIMCQGNQICFHQAYVCLSGC